MTSTQLFINANPTTSIADQSALHRDHLEFREKLMSMGIYDPAAELAAFLDMSEAQAQTPVAEVNLHPAFRQAS